MLKAFLTFLIPLLYFPPLIIFLHDWQKIKETSQVWQIIGLIITLIGIVFWSWGFILLGKKSFSVLPKAKILQTTGIYRYFRHPIYLGIILTYSGLSLCLASITALLYVFLVICSLCLIRAIKEEKVLFEQFGQKYLDYKKRTIL